MKTNPNDPINSRPYSHDERPSGGYEGYRPETFQAFTGLTKREYFAALAMEGYLSSYTGSEISKPENMAIRAVAYADALINELNK
jgi:hypothetical protein